MTTLEKSASKQGWVILFLAALGPLAFGFMFYGLVRDAVRAYADSYDSYSLYSVSVMLTLAFGLLLELRALSKLVQGTTTTLRNCGRVVCIHLGILVGVLFLVLMPVASLSRFPGQYEHMLERYERHPSPPFDPDLDKVMFVGMNFLMLWVFIKLGLSLLEGTERVLNKMISPNKSDETATTSETLSVSE